MKRTRQGSVQPDEGLITSQPFHKILVLILIRKWRRKGFITRGGTRVHSQLPNECDYLPRVLEFMAIIFVIIEISSALWTQEI